MITGEEFYTALLERAREQASYFGAHVYQVVSQTGEQVTLRPATFEAGLTEELVMDKAHGIPGVQTTLQRGALVLVTWRGGNPGAPMVVGYFGGETVVRPTRIRLDVAEDLGASTGIQAGGVRPVAMGDTTETWIVAVHTLLDQLVTSLSGGPPNPPLAAAAAAESVAYSNGTLIGWSSTKLGTG